MLWLKLNHVSKRGHWCQITRKQNKGRHCAHIILEVKYIPRIMYTSSAFYVFFVFIMSSFIHIYFKNTFCGIESIVSYTTRISPLYQNKNSSSAFMTTEVWENFCFTKIDLSGQATVDDQWKTKMNQNYNSDCMFNNEGGNTKRLCGVFKILW